MFTVLHECGLLRLVRHAAWASALAATLAFTPVTPASQRVSGLYGTVRRGPVRPVCRVGVPCDEPAGRLTIVFSRAGRDRARVTTSASGSYRVLLAPGIYRVRAASGFRRTPRPSAARVRRGHVDRVDFFFDTGIR